MDILERIYDSTLKFLTPLRLEETYKKIVDEAIKIVNGDSGRIFMVENGKFNPVYNSTEKTPLKNPRRRGNVYAAFFKNKSYMVHAKDVEISYPELTKTGIRSIIYIPLSHDNVVYGVMTVRSKKDKKFGKHEFDILKLFGSMASLAIRKAQLYNQVKKSLEDRDIFISLASHELRTPLTTINGYIQLLLSRIAERKPIDNKWILELSFESARMKSLIDEFLEINRVRSGKMIFNFSEISLSEVINHVISTFKFNFPKRKLTVKNVFPKRDLIIGDSGKIHQILINILENAVKYSATETNISLELSYNLEFLIISVSDKGQGIAKKDLPMVFKGFYKGENSIHEGMGLGLYLAKNIVDRHHGEINIKSNLNKGTKVIVKIPRLGVKK